MESPTSPASRPDFYDFLDRMRRPATADLFRSIKSFLVSFSFHEPNAEEDGGKVQAFLAEMETAIRDHPLWANATNQEIDHALEGLEKYIMTKLFDRTFGSSAEDAMADMEISEKIDLLQQFVKPHHLDIPKVLHNEASWLLAVKELQKINSFKAPREKLLCVMSCCQVINNLLLNVSMSNDRTLSGADEFLPILIYITIKANPPQLCLEGQAWRSGKSPHLCLVGPEFEPAYLHCTVQGEGLVPIIPSPDPTLCGSFQHWVCPFFNPPQLHSNLKFVQLFRRETMFISEVEYYLTNLISAKMFIINVNGRSLSMDESEFQKHMESARLSTQISVASPSSSQGLPTSARALQEESDIAGYRFPFMDSETESLTPGEVKQLHDLYSLTGKRRSYTHDCSQFRSSMHICARGLQQVQCNTGLVPVNSGIAHGRFRLCWSCSTGMSYF